MPPGPLAASPVPTYMTCGLEGAIAIAPTGTVSVGAPIGRHEYPLSSDFHRPPCAEPAKNQLRCEGCCTRARIAPPTLRGPIGTQPWAGLSAEALWKWSR